MATSGPSRNWQRRRRVRGSRRTVVDPALSDEELLQKRFCDLRLTLRHSVIDSTFTRIRRDLKRRGIRFAPHVWLSEEWFSPDGVPGIAIAFYMAHPRLMRLERRMMDEVEGGNANWLTRIMRHEFAHALDNAYRLRRRKEWRETFGNPDRSPIRMFIGRGRPVVTSYYTWATGTRRAIHRRFCRNVRGVDAAEGALAARLSGLAGAAKSSNTSIG